MAGEKKRLGKREGGGQTNCHSSGAKYPSKESDAKGIKGKMSTKAYLRRTIDHRKATECRQKEERMKILKV